ncbi:MAG: GGDEF domain-containing protein [Deltaproteobacteria bacterium]|nr:MAG: GGDEF domain-containing protein [Deltaproteobacteria bacterium]
MRDLATRLQRLRARARRGAWGGIALALLCALPLLFPTSWPFIWLGTAGSAILWLRFGEEPAGRRCLQSRQGVRALLAVTALAGVTALAAQGGDVLRALVFTGLVFVGASLPERRAWLGASAVAGFLLFGPLAVGTGLLDGLAYGLAAPLVLLAGREWLTHPDRATAPSSATPASPRPASGSSRTTDAMDAAGRSSERVVRAAIQRSLEALRAGLRARTALLFEQRRDGRLLLANAEFSGDEPFHGPFDARMGVFGLLLAEEGSLLLNDLQHDAHFRPWADGDGRGNHLLACTLRDGDLVRGHLVIERAAGEPPFTDVDRIALDATARQILAIGHTERLLRDTARDRARLERTRAALASLQTALSAEEVCAIARDILRREVRFDFLAFTNADDPDGHRILFADGDGADDLAGTLLPERGGLVPLAASRGQALPWGGRVESPDTSVFGIDQDPLRGTSAVLVLPMTLGNRVLGTLVLADRTRAALDDAQRQELEVMLHCIAGALANAFTLASMVRRASTDSLTGLLNHGTLKARAAEAHARAERSDAPVSLIMLDIDHFKRLNDTWGHAAGDEALRVTANLLRERCRRVDVVARYGGEEFAILLEQTPLEGAERMAHSLKDALASLPFLVGSERIPLTASFGVASTEHIDGPVHALFEAADQAMYAAKRAGRNDVRCADHATARTAA